MDRTSTRSIAGRLTAALFSQGSYLILSSGFAISLLAVRIYFSRGPTYFFLTWNLFLAWLPYLFALCARYAHQRQRFGWVLVFGALWLLFFPNAPYILTDFLHLAPRSPIPMWYDIFLLAAYSWAGLSLALTSLGTMHWIARERVGRVGGWLFAATMLVLASLGVYLGRFLGWNSWDIFAEPVAILADFAVRLRHPLLHIQTYAVTSLFSAFLFICYLPLAHAHPKALWERSRAR